MRFDQVSKKKIAACSAGIVLFCYGFSVVFGAMTYHTNDDIAIQNYIANFTFDGLWWVPPWISILLSYPLGLLSYFFPKITWWYAASQFSVAVSLFVVHYVALRMAQIKKVPFWLVLVLLAVFDSVYSVVSIAEIAFTIVPIVIGSAVISLAAYYPFAAAKHRKYIAGAVFVGIVTAISHRWQSGTIAAAFLLLAIAIVLSEKYGLLSVKMIVRTIVFAVVVGAVSLGISGLNRTVNKVAQSEEWVRYNSARSAWKDYQHDSYEDNPEIYHAVGWDADTYYFASNWIFLSDEITEESFRYLVDHSETNHHNISLGDNLINSLRKMKNDPRIACTMYVMLLVYGFVFVFALMQKDWKSILYLLADMLFCAALLVYLSCFVGRVIYRTVFIILYPTTLIAILIFIISYRKPGSRTQQASLFACLFVVLFLWTGCFNKLTQITSAKKDQYESYAREQLTLAKYESENRDKTFISQGFSSITYKRVSEIPIGNASGMGGALWNTNYMKHFQEVNNIKRLNWTVFELPHVYFLGRFNDKTAYIVDYLRREYNCKGVAVVEQIEDDYDIYCMKYVYEGNEAEFASYYTVVDGNFVEVFR